MVKNKDQYLYSYIGKINFIKSEIDNKNREKVFCQLQMAYNEKGDTAQYAGLSFSHEVYQIITECLNVFGNYSLIDRWIEIFNNKGFTKNEDPLSPYFGQYILFIDRIDFVNDPSLELVSKKYNKD